MLGKHVNEHTSEAVFMIDGSDVITSCNRAAEMIFGWPQQDIRGKVFSQTFLPADSGETYRSSFHDCTDEDGDFQFMEMEGDVLHRDGYAFPAELNICPLHHLSGSHFIVTVRDIRLRKHRLAALDQVNQNQQIINAILKIGLEEHSLEEVLRQALDYVLTLNSPRLMYKGAIMLVDGRSDRLVLKVHRGLDEIQVRACGSIPFGTCHCGRAAMTGEIQFSECVDDRHDIKVETLAPHGHYCVPIRSGDNLLGVLSLYIREGHKENDEEKEVLQAIGNILAGVVERKRNETQRYRLIRKQEAMITRIFDEKKLTDSIIQSLSAGLMVLDGKGRIVMLNPSGRTILGQFGDVEAGDPEDFSWFAELSAVKGMSKVRNHISEKRGEIRQVNARGEKRILKYTMVPWENFSGQRIGSIFQFKDLTEKLRIQQEMEKMNRLGTVAEIASAVAHEVRNPLAGIKTMSQAIGERCDDGDENKEYITRIIRQVDRLNDLLSEFFTYARPGKAKKEQVPIRCIVNEIRQLLKVKLDGKRILLNENYAPGLPDIHVDPDQLQQVFLNLMLNSIDAMGRNGKIEIQARLVDRKQNDNCRDLFPDMKDNTDYVAVSFRDNGKGMSPETAAKAFEPFYTTKHNGSGLGLAIVYRIISENNAFIMIDPSNERGVGFIMLFESASQAVRSGPERSDSKKMIIEVR